MENEVVTVEDFEKEAKKRARKEKLKKVANDVVNWVNDHREALLRAGFQVPVDLLEKRQHVLHDKKKDDYGGAPQVRTS